MNRFYWGLVLLAMLAGAGQAWAQPASTGSGESSQAPTESLGFMPRPSVTTNVGNGIGYKQGYNRFGMFMPVFQEPGDFLTFGDARFLVDYSGRLGGSGGMGHRMYSEAYNRTFGAYLYGDVRNTTFTTFSQMSGGFESLGQIWDFRTNFYVPIGTQLGQQQGFQPLGAPFLAGNNIFSFGTKRVDQAMTGLDMQFAAAIPGFQRMRAFAGPYWFTGTGTSDAIGGRAGVSAQLGDFVNTSVAIQSDGVFGTNVIGGLTIAWPGNRPNPQRTDVNVRNRLADDVQKLDLVVVDQQNREDNYAYTNPASGEAYHAIYVAQAAPAGGDGTIEHPFQNLVQAQNAVQQYDVLYVNNGTYFTALTLPRDVYLLGDGTSHTLPTVGGSFTFPTASNPWHLASATETIFNINGPAITIDNGDVVRGMTVDGTNTSDTPTNTSQGIVGSGADNVTIQFNTIKNVELEAIKLGGPKGTNVIAFNTINTNFNDAIQVSSNNNDTNNLTVSNNTISNSAGDGVKLNIGDTSVMNATVQNNTISGTGKNGVLVQGFSTASDASKITIANNTISTASTSANQAAIKIDNTSGTIAATVSNNTLTLASASVNGIFIETESSGTMNGTVSGNVLSGTYGTTPSSSNRNIPAGINLTGRGASSQNITVSGNTTNGTYGRGFSIYTPVVDSDGNAINNTSSLTATVRGNTFNNPTLFGGAISQPAGAGGVFDTSAINATIAGNTFNNSISGGGINIDSSGDSGSTFNVNIGGSVLADHNTFSLGSAGQNAVTVTSANFADGTVNATGNSISGTFNRGFLLTSNGNSSLTGTLTSNIISGTFTRGIDVVANNSSFNFITGLSNTVSGSSQARGISLTVNNSAVAEGRYLDNALTNVGATDFYAETNGTAVNPPSLLLDVERTVGFPGALPKPTIQFTNNNAAAFFGVVGDPTTLNPGATVNPFTGTVTTGQPNF